MEKGYEARRITKAECNSRGVFVYLNTDDNVHEMYRSTTLMSLIKEKKVV